MADRVHIVWDNSNIFIAGRKYCDENEWKGADFRIYFKNLIDLAAANRKIEHVFCVGSVPPPTDAVWGHIEKQTGKKPELYERGAQSGKEQAVDQALQTRMLRLGYDYDPPETLVLLTGDGRGDGIGEGFFADAKRLHKMGWHVELIAWTHACSTPMRAWAETNGVYVPLEKFYGSVTFIQNQRVVKSLPPKLR